MKGRILAASWGEARDCWLQVRGEARQRRSGGGRRLGAFGSTLSVVALPGWKGADVGLRKLVARTVQRGLRVVSVNLPTWIVAGDRDQLSPISDLTRLCDALPTARMRLLPGAGHLAHQEDAEAMSDLVAGCVSDLASS